jgi:hypothetical protein
MYHFSRRLIYPGLVMLGKAVSAKQAARLDSDSDSLMREVWTGGSKGFPSAPLAAFPQRVAQTVACQAFQSRRPYSVVGIAPCSAAANHNAHAHFPRAAEGHPVIPSLALQPLAGHKVRFSWLFARCRASASLLNMSQGRSAHLDPTACQMRVTRIHTLRVRPRQLGSFMNRKHT